MDLFARGDRHSPAALCQEDMDKGKTEEVVNFCDNNSFLIDAQGEIKNPASDYGLFATVKPPSEGTSGTQQYGPCYSLDPSACPPGTRR